MSSELQTINSNKPNAVKSVGEKEKQSTAKPISTTPSAQSTAEEKPISTEKKKRGRKPVFKPTQFDLDLIHLIREGATSTDELLYGLGVARSELIQRLDLLKTENLVAEEKDGANLQFGLTVNGYNFYASKGAKKVGLKKSFSGEVKLYKHKQIEKHDAMPVQGQKHVNDFLSSTEVVDLGGKLGRMDLEEIIKRYGPSSEQKDKFLRQKATEINQEKKQVQPQIQRPVQQPTLASPIAAAQPVAGNVNSSDICDLCKSDFKMSMNNPELAKYGHCFCGAAYHKECYDSLLSDNAKCIRCGKKLFLIVDKQSREAISGLRDAFE